MQDYSFTNDLYKNTDAMIYTCGYETCTPGHSYGPIVRHGYMIHYIMKGSGIYKAKGNVYQLKAGDAFSSVPGRSSITKPIQKIPGPIAGWG